MPNHYAESNIYMSMILKYNTCMINPIGIINKQFISLLHQIWTFLYEPVVFAWW